MAHHLITGAVEPSKLSQEIGLTDFEQKFVKPNRDLYEGDHWRQGAGYIGSPPASDDRNAGEIWTRLHRSFTSKNVVKEVTDRQVSAILGNVPDYGFTVRRALKKIPKVVPDPDFIPDPANPQAAAPMIPDPEGATVTEPLRDDEAALIDEAKAALEVFYTKRKPLRWLKKMLRARLLGGRGYLRLYVPPKFREKASGRVAAARDLNEAVERIFISQPDIENAVRLIDDETQDELALYNYKRADGRTKVFEISFTDDANRTVIATIEQTAPLEISSGNVFGLLPPAPASVVNEAEGRLLANVPDEFISDPLELGGHLTMFEMSGEPLISEQIRSNNASVNLNLTMANHVTVESGFRELAVTNVEFEKEKIPDRYAPSGFREVPKRMKRGAGVIHNFMSVTLEDAQGNETVAPTTVNAFEPVPIKNFDEGQSMFRRNILDETHQLWALITGDAAPSGESRIQALADFVMFALDFKEETDDAGAWLLETVLYWASALMGKPGRFAGIRANFSSRLYVGKLSGDERRTLMSEVKERLRSREGYMLIVGDIPDPAEEMSRIEAEDEKSLEGQRARLALEADRKALEGDGSGAGE